MLTQFGQIALFILVIVLFISALPIAAFIFRLIGLAPHKPTQVKTSTYESGMETVGKSWIQFNVRYYTYALIFVALDVTAILLYTWAVDLKSLGAAGLGVALVFIAILAVGYLYTWKKKFLEWK
ncbi:MAG: NADH-quinone oxidoreductase subunit A [Chloroflexi bacterium]|nr:NADH-quinone oxidoreductase subunit A [Chloroflexota bacterium]